MKGKIAIVAGLVFIAISGAHAEQTDWSDW